MERKEKSEKLKKAVAKSDFQLPFASLLEMNINRKQIWQVATGDANWRYVDLLLHWGVIVNGPSDQFV